MQLSPPKPAGRPRKAPAERRHVTISLRLTQADAAHLQLAAGLSGVHPSVYAHRVVVAHLQAVAPVASLWQRVEARLQLALAQRPSLLSADDTAIAIEGLTRRSPEGLLSAFEALQRLESAATVLPVGEVAQPDELLQRLRAAAEQARDSLLRNAAAGHEVPELAQLDQDTEVPADVRANVFQALADRLTKLAAGAGAGAGASAAKRPSARRERNEP